MSQTQENILGTLPDEPPSGQEIVNMARPSSLFVVFQHHHRAGRQTIVPRFGEIPEICGAARL